MRGSFSQRGTSPTSFMYNFGIRYHIKYSLEEFAVRFLPRHLIYPSAFYHPPNGLDFHLRVVLFDLVRRHRATARRITANAPSGKVSYFIVVYEAIPESLLQQRIMYFLKLVVNTDVGNTS